MKKKVLSLFLVASLCVSACNRSKSDSNPDADADSSTSVATSSTEAEPTATTSLFGEAYKYKHFSLIRDTLKKAITTYGAVTAELDDTHENWIREFDGKTTYNVPETDVYDHAITVVGWDDLTASDIQTRLGIDFNPNNCCIKAIF